MQGMFKEGQATQEGGCLMTMILKALKSGGRVYLTEKQGAKFLGIALATLQKHRKDGTGAKVFRKAGFQRSQPKKVMYVYRIPDLVVWYQTYMLRPIIRQLRGQANGLEKSLKTMAKYYISDKQFYADNKEND